MTTTGNQSLLTQYIFQLLTEKKAELGLAGVFYGDQMKIPHTPTVCVEPGDKRRQLSGTSRQTMTTTEIVIMLYHSTIGPNKSTREEADVLAESIESILHNDRQLGDFPDNLTTHCFVRSMEPGYASRGGSFFVSYKITLEAETKELLPS